MGGGRRLRSEGMPKVGSDGKRRSVGIGTGRNNIEQDLQRHVRSCSARKPQEVNKWLLKHARLGRLASRQTQLDSCCRPRPTLVYKKH